MLAFCVVCSVGMQRPTGHHASVQEGWDGPALLVFSDGRKIGARLDRNGLRPARFWRTRDDVIYVASEVGVLGDVLTRATDVVAKGRLGPGQTVVANLDDGTFKTNAEVAQEVAASAPYGEWMRGSKHLSEVRTSCVLAHNLSAIILHLHTVLSQRLFTLQSYGTLGFAATQDANS